MNEGILLASDIDFMIHGIFKVKVFGHISLEHTHTAPKPCCLLWKRPFCRVILFYCRHFF